MDWVRRRIPDDGISSTNGKNLTEIRNRFGDHPECWIQQIVVGAGSVRIRKVIHSRRSAHTHKAYRVRSRILVDFKVNELLVGGILPTNTPIISGNRA
jgi:hypothetical protein